MTELVRPLACPACGAQAPPPGLGRVEVGREAFPCACGKRLRVVFLARGLDPAGFSFRGEPAGGTEVVLAAVLAEGDAAGLSDRVAVEGTRDDAVRLLETMAAVVRSAEARRARWRAEGRKADPWRDVLYELGGAVVAADGAKQIRESVLELAGAAVAFLAADWKEEES